MSVDIRFSATQLPNVSTLWNIEQLMMTHTGSSLRVRMDFGNMDLQPTGDSNGALLKLMEIDLDDMGTAAVGRSMNARSRMFPLFLGSASKGVNGDVSFDLDNEDGTSFSVMAQGFFWGPGAINAPGGPQRPATSLYGA